MEEGRDGLQVVVQSGLCEEEWEGRKEGKQEEPQTAAQCLEQRWRTL